MPFIVIEGIDGAGKTTIARCINDILKQYNKKTILTREPGGLKISEEIRNIILSKDNHLMDPWTEVLLYNAARMEHIAKVIRPALLKNEYLICDRFTDSTLAYQGYGRGLNVAKIIKIQNTLLRDIKPDLVIFVDMNYLQVARRLKARGENANRFDLETQSFFDKVYTGYKSITNNDTSGRYVFIRGDLSTSERTLQLQKILMEKLKIEDVDGNTN